LDKLITEKQERHSSSSLCLAPPLENLIDFLLELLPEPLKTNDPRAEQKQGSGFWDSRRNYRFFLVFLVVSSRSYLFLIASFFY
jgi:hypothetical protein